MPPVKCAKDGCHKRRNFTHAEVQELRDLSRQHGVRVGVYCPQHVKEVLSEITFEEGDRYGIGDMSLEDYLVELARETPSWHQVFLPQEEGL